MEFFHSLTSKMVKHKKNGVKSYPQSWLKVILQMLNMDYHSNYWKFITLLKRHSNGVLQHAVVKGCLLFLKQFAVKCVEVWSHTSSIQFWIKNCLWLLRALLWYLKQPQTVFWLSLSALGPTLTRIMSSLYLFYSLKRFEIYLILNLRPFHTISCSRIKTLIALRSVCSSLSIPQTLFKTPLHPITGDKLINKNLAIFNSQPLNNRCEHSNYENLFIFTL